MLIMKKKIWNQKTGMAFLVLFLLTFMLLIFGPAEIFFGNYTQFEFVYGEFAGCLAALAVFLALIGTGVFVFLHPKINRILLSITFGTAVAGYIQVMFWNKGLDLLGLNPEGYQVNQGRVWWNLGFWLFVIGGVILFSILKVKIWEKCVVFISAFLLAIQMVALVTLMLGANGAAYRHQSQWRLSGEDQFTVSSQNNIIVFIMDFTGNERLQKVRNEYPGCTDFLHDFTEYNNADCVYMGTYPSLAHMMTGCELDMSKSVNDWCKEIWQDKKTRQFYEDLHHKNYVTNLYTSEISIICGANSGEILNNKISNIANTTDEIDVNYKLLYRTMVKMSGYRMFPEILKPFFYTDMSEYLNVIEIKNNSVMYQNYDFYDSLLEKGLTVDEKSNYLIVQHLAGTHSKDTDAEGHYTRKNDSTTVTLKGCLVILEEYLNQLKALDLYDLSAIIITADHGKEHEVQPIFFIKEPIETNKESPVNDAPISHKEFTPTLAYLAGLNPEEYGSGKTIYDYAPGEKRERTYWRRNIAALSDLPVVPNFTGEKDGYSNAYYGYRYIGGADVIQNIDWTDPDIIVPMVDSMY